MNKSEALRILGLHDGATGDEIRGAYRSLAQIAHPDRGGDSVMFQLVQDAWEVLRPDGSDADEPTMSPESAEPVFPDTRRTIRRSGYMIREVFGYSFSVVPPLRITRLLSRLMSAIRMPMNMIGPEYWTEEFGPPATLVKVTNPRGKWRSLQRADTVEDAVQACNRAADDLERLGVSGWSQAMSGQIPMSFFE